MGYKNFRLNIVIRVILLIVTIFIFLNIVGSSQYIFTQVFLVVLLVIQILELIFFVEKSNRDLISFLEAIRFSDFSRTFQAEGLGTSFDSLKKAFNQVIKDFQKIRSEKEAHYFYLQNVLQQVGVSILAFNNDGEIEMINDAAKKLFKVRNINNISALSVWSSEIEYVLKTIKPNESKLLKVQDEDEIFQLSIFASSFKIQNRDIKLVTIKNIQAELEEQEMEAWQKLIRVLTHEIMNSIAPIASLTSTVNIMVEDIAHALEENLNEEKYDKEEIEDIKVALQTIHKRSTGLIHFVDTYRNLTKIPKPNFTIFYIKQQIEYINSLLDEELHRNGIQLIVEINPPDLQITADEQLIEQVLINLVKNSIHALENKPDKKIFIKAFVDERGRTLIQVVDNGTGIIKEVRDKIFIPFFTTKTNGSGIGLSLSKQIMRLHGGTINVLSEPDVKTCFTLTFN